MGLSDDLPRGETSSNREIADIKRDIRELGPSIAKSFKPIVAGIQATVIATVQASYTTTVDLMNLLAGKSNTNHKHSASDITTGGTTGSGFTVGGDITANTGVFPTGLRSAGAFNNNLGGTTNIRVVYQAPNGDYGYAPSTLASKVVLGDYKANYDKWLALTPKVAYYRKDDTKTPFATFIAEDVQQNFPEFTFYDEDGKLAGIRYEMMVVGLHSAFVQAAAVSIQDRAQLNARLAAMDVQAASRLFQTYTDSSMTALGLNAEKTYTVTWPKAFVDANYLVSASVSSTGLALAAVASIVPGSQTSTGCKVSVRTLGLALAAGATLTVQAVHI